MHVLRFEIKSVDKAATIQTLLLELPSVRTASLAGSRQRGTSTVLSDLDIEVDVSDFEAFQRDLPELVEDLNPLGQMWDRLGDHRTYMLMLSGPLKVDIIVDVPQEERPPWEVSATTLPQIEHHFWDWILWLGSKHLHSEAALVQRELERMHEHLLKPLGVVEPPRNLIEAVASYRQARTSAEGALGVKLDRTMETEVSRALQDAGILGKG
jgi:predicted nucleotidyltransferase